CVLDVVEEHERCAREERGRDLFPPLVIVVWGRGQVSVAAECNDRDELGDQRGPGPALWFVDERHGNLALYRGPENRREEQRERVRAARLVNEGEIRDDIQQRLERGCAALGRLVVRDRRGGEARGRGVHETGRRGVTGRL